MAPLSLSYRYQSRGFLLTFRTVLCRKNCKKFDSGLVFKLAKKQSARKQIGKIVFTYVCSTKTPKTTNPSPRVHSQLLSLRSIIQMQSTCAYARKQTNQGPTPTSHATRIFTDIVHIYAYLYYVRTLSKNDQGSERDKWR